MSYLIRHADGRQYEVEDIKKFNALYPGSGFVVVAERNQAGEWIVVAAIPAPVEEPAPVESLDDAPAKKAKKHDND